MRGVSIAVTMFGFLMLSTQGTAFAQHRQGQLVLGAQLGLGMQWSARNSDLKGDSEGLMVGMADTGVEDVTNSVGFSGGGWFFADYYLLDMLALEGGLGFVSKGGHWKTTASVLGFSEEFQLWAKLAYMEIPLGVKLDISNFRISALFLFNFALSGRWVWEQNDDKDDDSWDDDTWDNWRRFNIGLRLGVGYAIPVGPIVIVPGVDWSTHFVNDMDFDGEETEDWGLSWMNFFFNVALEYALPL